MTEAVELATGRATGAAVLERALDLWIQVMSEPDCALSELAAKLRVPASTAHRWIAVFERRGLLARIGRGRYSAGLVLAQMAGLTETNIVLAAVGRPLLRHLGHHPDRTAHLGVLEDDMVTYLVKEGAGASTLFTREGMQLEAYCSGIGKVLLAHLPPDVLDRYLEDGPFIRMTARTLTEPNAIRAELEQVRIQGYALDRAEASEDVYCVAAPVHDADGRVVAALSVSGPSDEIAAPALIGAMLGCAGTLSSRLVPFGDLFHISRYQNPGESHSPIAEDQGPLNR